ncbi:Zn-ribbon domain-containing protein [Candidatus Woesearchaeota archaeon]|nr:Zn-ribbon domain-containing protein [Candidatus Woesearchaeota archaeon]
MPHQCVRCNTFYEDGANELLKGCPCGAKLFFYVKKDSLEAVKEQAPKLTKKEVKQIEKDIKEMIGAKELDAPVILDFESIKLSKPGQYELDLVQLFKGEPLVYKLEDGKYIIDIPSTFQIARKDKKEEKK